MYSYHHNTIIFQNMTPSPPNLLPQSGHNLPQLHYRLLSCTAHATAWLAVCLAMWSAREVFILEGVNFCNITLHLAAVWGPECCFLLGWPSWPGQTCVAAWTLHLKSCEKQQFLYQGSHTDKPNKEVMAETCTKLKSNHLAPLAIREHWRHHWVCDKETLRL